MRKLLIITALLAVLLGVLTAGSCEPIAPTPGPTLTPDLSAPGAYIPLGNVGTVTSGTWQGTSVAWNYLGSRTSAQEALLLTNETGTSTVVFSDDPTLNRPTLGAVQMSGTWTASGTVTLPAFTLGGAVTGASQNITGLGTVLVGSTTVYGRYGQVLELNASNTNGGLSITTWSDTDTSALLDFRRSGSDTLGNYAVITSGWLLGGMYFLGSDGTDFQTAAYLTVKAIGTVGADRVAGQWEFHTLTDAATSVDTTVLTMTAATAAFNNVNLLIGSTAYTSGGTNVLAINNGTTPTNGPAMYATGGKLYVMDSNGVITALTP